MLRGVYQAGAALQQAGLQQEFLAENLANATTPGYRRQGLAFLNLVDNAGAAQSGGGAVPKVFTSFMPGPLQQTGQPFDLALSGDAFFVLDGPQGPVYTRNGAFELTASGDLQTHGGLRVRGQGGRISIPTDANQVRVNKEGVILADGSEVGRLELARFASTEDLRRVGPSMFEGPAPLTPEPGTVRVEQGYREGANVDMVHEMIAMMLGMRQYEAAQRALRALGEAASLNTRPGEQR